VKNNRPALLKLDTATQNPGAAEEYTESPRSSSEHQRASREKGRRNGEEQGRRRRENGS
jgi:hypothetical protein